MADSSMETCATCYGEGTSSSDLAPCQDCAGLGKLPGALVRTEWRLRQLEADYDAQGGQSGQDVKWLAAEVRRAHHALLQILAASQDADESDALTTKIRFLANDVLRVYPPQAV
jgi:hypothetical protein